MAYENIAKSLYVGNQLPLDKKTYFGTFIEMRSLGLNNFKVFGYYEYMKVMCAETGQEFVWKEVDPSYTGGVLDANFVYPTGTITEGVDYSGKHFNFVEVAKATNNVVAKPYMIFKHPDNDFNNEYLEENDVVYGYFGNNQFIEARYKGGPLTTKGNFAIMRERDPESYE